MRCRCLLLFRFCAERDTTYSNRYQYSERRSSGNRLLVVASFHPAFLLQENQLLFEHMSATYFYRAPNHSFHTTHPPVHCPKSVSVNEWLLPYVSGFGPGFVSICSNCPKHTHPPIRLIAQKQHEQSIHIRGGADAQHQGRCLDGDRRRCTYTRMHMHTMRTYTPRTLTHIHACTCTHSRISRCT